MNYERGEISKLLDEYEHASVQGDLGTARKRAWEAKLRAKVGVGLTQPKIPKNWAIIRLAGYHPLGYTRTTKVDFS